VNGAECGAVADADARRWLACRADEPEEEPEIVFCPVCAGREMFDWRRPTEPPD
jgi:hypothetical protein